MVGKLKCNQSEINFSPGSNCSGFLRIERDKTTKTKNMCMMTTGRFFKCLSLKGEESQQVMNYFEVGKIYAEAKFDFLSGNMSNELFVFLLYTDKKFPIADSDGSEQELSVSFYVSAMDFELVDHVIPLNYN